MDREAKVVKLKLDVIFKKMFGDARNADVITAFVAALLEIPKDSIRSVNIENVELPPEYLHGKFSRLDIKMTLDDRIINIEIQVHFEPDYKDRSVFYWAKLFTGDLKSGEDYEQLKQTICINIINFNLFDCDEYHSNFKIMENDRHEILSDKFGIHFFELKKINKSRMNKPMEDWLDLINAETEGDLMNLEARTQMPEVQKAIVMLRNLSADENTRRVAEYRERQMHDEASAINFARTEGINIGRTEGITEGINIGRTEGINIGRTEGINIGRTEGINIGRTEGINIGRTEGINIGIANMLEYLRSTGVDEAVLRQAEEKARKVTEGD